MIMLDTYTRPEPATLRSAMGKFVTGVAVAITGAADDLTGATVNSLTSISLDPPIVLIALSHTSRTSQVLTACERFSLSILEISQEQAALDFAVRGGGRCEGREFDTLPSGLLAIPGALAQLDCTLLESVAMGDHQVFYGQVTALAQREGESLAFRAGQFGGFHTVDSGSAR
jgi:flavin reductase (DIM6/NTAB) family NADH-FMN oxidoreductase RutF